MKKALLTTLFTMITLCIFAGRFIINTDNIYVKDSYTIEGKLVDYIHLGDTVEVMDYKTANGVKWAHIECNDITGWTLNQWLSTVKDSEHYLLLIAIIINVIGIILMALMNKIPKLSLAHFGLMLLVPLLVGWYCSMRWSIGETMEDFYIEHGFKPQATMLFILAAIALMGGINFSRWLDNSKKIFGREYNSLIAPIASAAFLGLSFILALNSSTIDITYLVIMYACALVAQIAVNMYEGRDNILNSLLFSVSLIVLSLSFIILISIAAIKAISACLLMIPIAAVLFLIKTGFSKS